MFQEGSEDTGVINLRDSGGREFEVEAMNASEEEDRATTRVKVRFDKFVDLIANHAFEDVVLKHRAEDVVISTDLLADLANAKEDHGEKKGPGWLIFGILIGVILTWIVIKL